MEKLHLANVTVSFGHFYKKDKSPDGKTPFEQYHGVMYSYLQTKDKGPRGKFVLCWQNKIDWLFR
jgi:hypothetical protein